MSLLDGTNANPSGWTVSDPELVVLHGGAGVFWISIDDGTDRVVFTNADVPRLIDARDVFKAET
jgi:hypothetical protein